MNDDTYTVEVNVTIRLSVTDDDNASQFVADALATIPNVYEVVEHTDQLIYHTD